MIELFSFSGITIIITSSTIMSYFRDKFSMLGHYAEEMIHCPMCTGFWVGLFMSLVRGLDITVYAPATSLLSWIIFSYIDYSQSKTIFFDNKNTEVNDNEE
ncbi:DUF1360 domain-containing protein [bacterium]|nr:DUF1360 domain-containing protein [bacterium]